ncbi:PEP-CTERM sorting domain-containing protein [Methylophilus sp. 3sh_L]|uniref:PEP-CTERM sorting domain-containing protein n=1 Tax=Methylophilus sp. 3sh_L TaxID=3377114 RepID=UPI00398F3DBB
MQITKALSSLVMFVSLSTFNFFAMNANAATYNVEQTYSGLFSQTVTEVDTGLGYSNILYKTTVNLLPNNLVSGDASLFSTSLTTSTEFLFNVATSVLSCAGVCQFTETLKNGDTIFGTILSNGPYATEANVDPAIASPFSKIWYTGDLLITGGTGLFAGATGYGTYKGVDDYTTMTQTLTSTFSVTPVPEPEGFALLLVGLGLIGVLVRRNRKAT